jgi:ribosomal peptide maturation radical SAM protein 1
MADNIMPLNFFDTLLPRLAASDWRMHIFYEQKSNLKRDQLALLKSAGVHSIQPGIEAFSTSLLQRMRKGVSGAQNLRLLVDCRSFGIEVIWNLLYGFPGEGTQEYLDTRALLPLLTHLSPPNKLLKVSFDRFSPYYMNSHAYPISNLRPHQNYEKIYPPGYDLSELAYHFVGSAPTVDVERPDIIDEMKSLVEAWNDAWCRPELPLLHVTRRPGHKPVLADTRRSGAAVTELLDPDLADAVTSVSHHRSEAVSAGIERGWVVELDGRYVGLATQN